MKWPSCPSEFAIAFVGSLWFYPWFGINGWGIIFTYLTRILATKFNTICICFDFWIWANFGKVTTLIQLHAKGMRTVSTNFIFLLLFQHWSLDCFPQTLPRNADSNIFKLICKYKFSYFLLSGKAWIQVTLVFFSLWYHHLLVGCNRRSSNKQKWEGCWNAFSKSDLYSFPTI